MQNVEPEVWQMMQSLFHLAVDKPEGEVDGILQFACSDPALRAQVKLLLEASRPTHSKTDGPDAESARRNRFGSYEILRHLGTGGTGTVYLVERRTGASLQKVALKVFRGYDAESFFTRSFAREEFILATLTHPCIPKLLDAGVSDGGEPFLVMEFADGKPLDIFCDSSRLSIEARLRLMLRVCDAVAYAHRNLIVHLDLKPSNLLASVEEPFIKLLDFGTSKLLEAGRTQSIAHMMTPGYAAPEQLRNEPTTTSCDIYALGAILFELLSGRKTFPEASMAAMAERSFRDAAAEPVETVVTEKAAEERGTSAAALSRALRGDLSTIVAKCLSPAAMDRYTSVDALAEDIRRYLDGRALIARPQTRLYLLRKFLGRNRAAVAAAAAATLVIIGSLGYGLWRQHQALQSAERAVQMQHFMTRLFRLAHSGAVGKPAASVGDLLQVGEETLPAFISNPADLRAARMSIAESMYDDEDKERALPLLKQLGEEAQRAGDVTTEAKADILESDLLYLTSTQLPLAETLASRAMSLTHDKRISPELRTEILALYVQNRDNLGDLNGQNMDRLRMSIQASERSHAPEDSTASAMNILALGLQARGQYTEALQWFDRSLSIYQRMPYSTCDVGQTMQYRGGLEDKMGDYTVSLQNLRQSYELLRRCAGEDDLGTLSAHAWMARMLVLDGQPQAAIDAVEPDLIRWRHDVGENSVHMRTPLMSLALAYLGLGRFADAEAASREEIRVMKGRVAQKSIAMATPETTLAAALAGQHRFAEALTWANAGVQDFPASPEDAPGVKSRFQYARQVQADVSNHLAASSR